MKTQSSIDNFGSLREYQEYLRQQMEAASSENNAERVLLLGFVSDGRNYLVDGRDIVDVHHLTQLEPIPIAKPWACGVANIKGTVHAITDFSILNGGSATKKGKFLTLTQDVMQGSALLIDGISSLFEFKNLGEMTPVNDENHPWIVGNFEIGQISYQLIDLVKLATDKRFSILQSGDAQ